MVVVYRLIGLGGWIWIAIFFCRSYMTAVLFVCVPSVFVASNHSEHCLSLLKAAAAPSLIGQHKSTGRGVNKEQGYG